MIKLFYCGDGALGGLGTTATAKPRANGLEYGSNW